MQNVTGGPERESGCPPIPHCRRLFCRRNLKTGISTDPPVSVNTAMTSSITCR